LIGLLKASEVGVKDLMAPISIDPYPNKKWGGRLSQLLMDHVVLVLKQGEWHLVCLAEIGNLKAIITCTNAQEFYRAFGIGAIFYDAIQLVYRRGLPLAVRAVHAKDLNDHHLGLDICYGEKAIAGEAKIVSMGWGIGNSEFYLRQPASFLRQRIVWEGITVDEEERDEYTYKADKCSFHGLSPIFSTPAARQTAGVIPMSNRASLMPDTARFTVRTGR